MRSVCCAACTCIVKVDEPVVDLLSLCRPSSNAHARPTLLSSPSRRSCLFPLRPVRPSPVLPRLIFLRFREARPTLVGFLKSPPPSLPLFRCISHSPLAFLPASSKTPTTPSTCVTPPSSSPSPALPPPLLLPTLLSLPTTLLALSIPPLSPYATTPAFVVRLLPPLSAAVLVSSSKSPSLASLSATAPTRTTSTTSLFPKMATAPRRWLTLTLTSAARILPVTPMSLRPARSVISLASTASSTLLPTLKATPMTTPPWFLVLVPSLATAASSSTSPTRPASPAPTLSRSVAMALTATPRPPLSASLEFRLPLRSPRPVAPLFLPLAPRATLSLAELLFWPHSLL